MLASTFNYYSRTVVSFKKRKKKSICKHIFPILNSAFYQHTTEDFKKISMQLSIAGSLSCSLQFHTTTKADTGPKSELRRCPCTQKYVDLQPFY